jgi:carbon monoxide dehydrogenase subunit G
VNITGTHALAAPRERVFAAIRDPRVLLAVIPGAQDVRQTGPDTYEGRIALRLPGAVGVYRTHVRLLEVVEPERATLDGRIEGSMGTITGHAAFTLADAPGGGTTLTYTGSGRIDGPLARLDGSIAERLATSLIDQGLRALDARLAPDARLEPDEPRTTEVPE